MEEEEKRHADKLEKGLTEVYNNLSDYAEEPTVTPEGKFQRIAQLMEKYQQEIT
jgi:rubrerythrin